MVYKDLSTTEVNPIEVVNSEYSRALVFIRYESKSTAFTCFSITSQPAVNNFTKLTGYHYNVSFVHPVVKSREYYVRRFFIVIVPTC